jgi:IMP dehydrogenase
MKIISNELALTFEDLNLVPADFSEIRSRADINTETQIGSTVFTLPIISSNMTSVFTPKLANTLIEKGGMSIIHRFCTVQENVELFNSSKAHGNPWVSVGASIGEMDRFYALYDAGARVFVLDLAQGNSIVAVESYNRMVATRPDVEIVVSDFSTGPQIVAFNSKVSRPATAYMVGQGCGSACKTREATGIGIPVMSAINSCKSAGFPLILNGGIRNSGDFCKALAAGVSAVVMGRLFAQCIESSSDYDAKFAHFNRDVGSMANSSQQKTYSGSASKESYDRQCKSAAFRAPEGESYTVQVNTNVETLYNTFSGGLRSSMSYLNSTNLTEFREKANFVKITNAGAKESGAYGKNL